MVCRTLATDHVQDMSLDDIIKLNSQQQRKKGPAGKGAKAGVKRAPLTVKKVGATTTAVAPACESSNLQGTLCTYAWACGETECCPAAELHRDAGSSCRLSFSCYPVPLYTSPALHSMLVHMVLASLGPVSAHRPAC
jgi:hypothetical protein